MKKLIIILIAILFSVPALAHKISAFLDVEGNKVTVISYFNDGTPVKNGKVEVYDEKTGKLILTGRTNNEGEFSFSVKKPSDYKVVVVAELGHKATAEVKASEFSGGDAEELRKILREELRAQLKPIHQRLLNIEMNLSKVSFTDIFAGIGWILGIFGAAALVYSRKQNGK